MGKHYYKYRLFSELTNFHSFILKGYFDELMKNGTVNYFDMDIGQIDLSIAFT